MLLVKGHFIFLENIITGAQLPLGQVGQLPNRIIFLKNKIRLTTASSMYSLQALYYSRDLFMVMYLYANSAASQCDS